MFVSPFDVIDDEGLALQVNGEGLLLIIDSLNFCQPCCEYVFVLLANVQLGEGHNKFMEYARVSWANSGMLVVTCGTPFFG